MVAGTPIHGNLVVINLSGRTVDLTSMCHLDFVAILKNGRIRQQVFFTTEACIRVPPWTMGPGLKRFPVTVETTYLGCADDPEDATAESPAYRNGVGPPPLPAGPYKTLFVEASTLHLPQPPPVLVTLRATAFEAFGS